MERCTAGSRSRQSLTPGLTDKLTFLSVGTDPDWTFSKLSHSSLEPSSSLNEDRLYATYLEESLHSPSEHDNSDFVFLSWPAEDQPVDDSKAVGISAAADSVSSTRPDKEQAEFDKCRDCFLSGKWLCTKKEAISLAVLLVQHVLFRDHVERNQLTRLFAESLPPCYRKNNALVGSAERAFCAGFSTFVDGSFSKASHDFVRACQRLHTYDTIATFQVKEPHPNKQQLVQIRLVITTKAVLRISWNTNESDIAVLTRWDFSDIIGWSWSGCGYISFELRNGSTHSFSTSESDEMLRVLDIATTVTSRSFRSRTTAFSRSWREDRYSQRETRSRSVGGTRMWEHLKKVGESLPQEDDQGFYSSVPLLEVRRAHRKGDTSKGVSNTGTSQQIIDSSYMLLQQEVKVNSELYSHLCKSSEGEESDSDGGAVSTSSQIRPDGKLMTGSSELLSSTYMRLEPDMLKTEQLYTHLEKLSEDDGSEFDGRYLAASADIKPNAMKAERLPQGSIAGCVKVCDRQTATMQNAAISPNLYADFPDDNESVPANNGDYVILI